MCLSIFQDLNNYYLRQENNISMFVKYWETNSFLNNYLKIDKDKLIRIFNTYKKDISNYKKMVNISEIYFNDDLLNSANEKFQKEFVLLLQIKLILFIYHIWYLSIF